MSEKKIELEKRIHSIQSDRDGLSSALEEATDRIMMLERQTREQEIQVGSFYISNWNSQSGVGQIVEKMVWITDRGI